MGEYSGLSGKPTLIAEIDLPMVCSLTFLDASIQIPPSQVPFLHHPAGLTLLYFSSQAHLKLYIYL